MRSIPLAMAWEAVWFNRWALMAGALGANVFPLIVLTCLRLNGPFDEQEGSFITMHLTLVQMSAFVFSALVFGAQGAPAKLYAYPVSTTTLVIWKMIPTALLVGVQSVMGTLLLNFLFGIHWPVLGPALVVAVAVISIQAALWLADKSLWLFVTVGGVGSVLGAFFKTRYGNLVGQPTQMWLHVTAGEWATLLLLALIAYAMAVVGVARNRRGDLPLSVGFIDWIDRQFEQDSSPVQLLRDRIAAQSWFEWRAKGWPMPGGVLVGLFVGGIGWLIFSRDPRMLTEGLLGAGMILAILAMVGGIILGNVGPDDGHFEMRTFLATRPLTCAQYGRTILWNSLRSLMTAWGMWAVVCLTACLLLRNIKSVAVESEIIKDFGWWYLPGTLLGPWIVLTSVTAVFLMGRTELHLKVFVGALSTYLVVSILAGYFLTSQARIQLQQLALATAGIALVLATIWMFWVALRHLHIRWRAALVAGTVWGVLAGAVISQAWRHPQDSIPNAIFLIGLMALVVAPVATFPLAIAMNRTR